MTGLKMILMMMMRAEEIADQGGVTEMTTTILKTWATVMARMNSAATAGTMKTAGGMIRMITGPGKAMKTGDVMAIQTIGDAIQIPTKLAGIEIQATAAGTETRMTGTGIEIKVTAIGIEIQATANIQEEDLEVWAVAGLILPAMEIAIQNMIVQVQKTGVIICGRRMTEVAVLHGNGTDRIHPAMITKYKVETIEMNAA
jgi:hypothetical protein